MTVVMMRRICALPLSDGACATPAYAGVAHASDEKRFAQGFVLRCRPEIAILSMENYDRITQS
jgi:hypothetical protein